MSLSLRYYDACGRLAEAAEGSAAGLCRVPAGGVFDKFIADLLQRQIAAKKLQRRQPFHE